MKAWEWIGGAAVIVALGVLYVLCAQWGAESCRERGGKVVRSHDSRGNYSQGCVEP